MFWWNQIKMYQDVLYCIISCCIRMCRNTSSEISLISSYPMSFDGTRCIKMYQDVSRCIKLYYFLFRMRWNTSSEISRISSYPKSLMEPNASKCIKMYQIVSFLVASELVETLHQRFSLMSFYPTGRVLMEPDASKCIKMYRIVSFLGALEYFKEHCQ